MGDALSTWFEARSCERTQSPNECGGHGTAAGFAIARLCYETLLSHGAAARLANDRHLVTPALDRIVEANTLLSGIGFESAGLATAHSVHNGLHRAGGDPFVLPRREGRLRRPDRPPADRRARGRGRNRLLVLRGGRPADDTRGRRPRRGRPGTADDGRREGLRPRPAHPPRGGRDHSPEGPRCHAGRGRSRSGKEEPRGGPPRGRRPALTSTLTVPSSPWTTAATRRSPHRPRGRHQNGLARVSHRDDSTVYAVVQGSVRPDFDGRVPVVVPGAGARHLLPDRLARAEVERGCTRGARGAG